MNSVLPRVEAREQAKRSRHPNYRLVKIHHSYTVDEIARRLDVHKNTVRNWIKQGLPTIDNRRPIHIHGPALREFLQAKRRKQKSRCEPGEIYCVRCRKPQSPAGDMADYKPQNATLGNLIGLCPQCDCFIYRRVNPAKLDQVCGNLKVTILDGEEHIVDSSRFSVISDFSKESGNNGRA